MGSPALSALHAHLLQGLQLGMPPCPAPPAGGLAQGGALTTGTPDPVLGPDLGTDLGGVTGHDLGCHPGADVICAS